MFALWCSDFDILAGIFESAALARTVLETDYAGWKFEWHTALNVDIEKYDAEGGLEDSLSFVIKEYPLNKITDDWKI